MIPKHCSLIAADPRVPQLAGGTPVHFIDLEFVGREMRVCEEITP